MCCMLYDIFVFQAVPYPILYLQAMWTKDSDVYDTNLYVKYDDKKFWI